MFRSPRALLATAFAFGAGLSAARAGDDAAAKCTIATKGDSPIVKACAEGGQAKATKTMKELVKKAKAKGTVFKCDSCHDNLDDYKLTKSARDDFAKLLAAAK